jgi:hypothetical protein
MAKRRSHHLVMKNFGKNSSRTSDSSKTVPIQVVLPTVKVEGQFEDDYDAALEAEIDDFYRKVIPEEDASVTCSDDEFRTDFECLVSSSQPARRRLKMEGKKIPSF